MCADLSCYWALHCFLTPSFVLLSASARSRCLWKLHITPLIVQQACENSDFYLQDCQMLEFRALLWSGGHFVISKSALDARRPYLGIKWLVTDTVGPLVQFRLWACARQISLRSTLSTYIKFTLKNRRFVNLFKSYLSKQLKENIASDLTNKCKASLQNWKLHFQISCDDLANN